MMMREKRQGERWKKKRQRTFVVSLFVCFGKSFPVSRRPPDGRDIDRKSRFLELSGFDMLFDQLGRNANHMLALPIFDHVHRLQRRDYVALRYARHVTVTNAEMNNVRP